MDPKKRLGTNGVEEIKNHPFFKNIDFQRVYKKDYTAPFIPESDIKNGQEGFKYLPTPNYGRVVNLPGFDYEGPSLETKNRI